MNKPWWLEKKREARQTDVLMSTPSLLLYNTPCHPARQEGQHHIWSLDLGPIESLADINLVPLPCLAMENGLIHADSLS